MSTRDRRNIMLGCIAALLMAAGPVWAQDASAEAQPPTAPPALTPSTPPSDGQAAPAVEATEAAPAPSGDTSVSEADLYYRRGVDLYKRELYREALTEFNRTLALDPNHQEARRFQEKANAQLQQTMVDSATTKAATPSFEAIDPETIRKQGETVQLSADEVRRDRVKNLLETAQRYMEAERYDVAVEIYSNILLIDPKNPDAKEGLHKATIGAQDQDGKEADKDVDEDRAKIRNYIENSKKLPEGADARGIKPYRFNVPEIEEEYASTKEKTAIEQTLESPVSIEFEDIHISEIVSFISDSWDVNIVIDNRAVEPPKKAEPQTNANQAPGAPGAFPPQPGAAAGGRRPGAPGNNPFGNNQMNRPGQQNQPTPTNLSDSDSVYGTKSSGVIPYINLKNVSLADGLQAMLRPLGLDYSVQPGFIWISKPDIIRRESFEKLETRYYELRNAGSETLFKIPLRNRFGGVSGRSGGYGGGTSGGNYGGGMSGGNYGGGMSGGYGGSSYGGGMSGGYGGSSYGGGMSGGYGGSSYGGGMSGGYGGSSYGGGMSGGSYGGMSGGSYGGGMSGGSYGGGMGGGSSDVTAISNISDLFSSINDMMVGETPATTGAMGLRSTGTGVAGGRGQMYGGGGMSSQDQMGQGGRSASSFGLGSDILSLLERLVPQVFEPYTNELLSDMIYNPANNMLIVKNTPSNLDVFEKQLAEIDVTPKQVSIEAKFLTVKLDDLKKVGFKWDMSLSDQNGRDKAIDSLSEETYDYDVNGDGVDEEIPFYTRPDGSNVIRNTITDATIGGLVNPASSTVPTFDVVGNILNNGDGDKLSVAFDFLDSLGESELLSAPRVTTMNRKPAVVADFSTEYFVTSIDTQIYSNVYGLNGGTNTNFVQNIRPTAYNFGIALSVTPQIRDNDQVRLWLNPEVRTRTGQKQFEQKQVINGDTVTNELVLPTTSWQAVWTNVIVHDGDTLVLGGLVQDNTVKAHDKMPYVADIPVIGYFFQGKKKETKQSSLLIFVTPDIIDSTGARFFDLNGENTATSSHKANKKEVTPVKSKAAPTQVAS